MRPFGLAAFLGILALPAAAAAADSCPQPSSKIATDRPDTIDDVEPARAAAINITGAIDLHAVRVARLGAKNAVGLTGERAVWLQIEDADVTR
jgi:hypothetical protein